MGASGGFWGSGRKWGEEEGAWWHCPHDWGQRWDMPSVFSSHSPFSAQARQLLSLSSQTCGARRRLSCAES